MASDLDTVLSNPRERAAYLYFAARSALMEFLDHSERPWEDTLVLLRRLAHDRHAYVLEDALMEVRGSTNKAALYQDIADRMTEPAAPEQRTIDSDLAEGRCT
jgi:hypothetical protein